MFDFSSVMKIKSAWDTFSRNHPKFMPFMQAVGREAIGDGTIMLRAYFDGKNDQQYILESKDQYETYPE